MNMDTSEVVDMDVVEEEVKDVVGAETEDEVTIPIQFFSIW